MKLLRFLFPFRCLLAPIGIACCALGVCYLVGFHLCKFDFRHVTFDIVVVTSGIVTHINLHEAYKLYRIRRRQSS